MMRETKATLSLVIPTLNGGELFRQLLETLSSQTVQPDELIVVDSSSDDETIALARQYQARVISIERSKFDHGGTRSMATRKCCGDIVVFLTQDAVPAHEDVIRNLVRPLKEDDVALSYGRQLPNSDASLFAASLRLFNYPDRSVTRRFSDREHLGLRTAFVSNSCAAYKKEILADFGYFPNNLIFGEDTCVAGKMLEKGYAVAYVSEAPVYHSHNYSIPEEFRRSFDIGVLHSLEKWLLETYGTAEGEGVKYVRFELSRIIEQKKYHLFPVSFLRNLAKYSGYKIGRMYDVLPWALASHLSMNRSWWQRNQK